MSWEWYDDANTFRLFIHLLLKANHAPKKWKGIMIERGQLIAGRKALGSEIRLSEQQIRTCLARLESTSEITIKATNKYSLITLVNYSSYQDKPKNQSADQPAGQPTSNQPDPLQNEESEEKATSNQPAESVDAQGLQRGDGSQATSNQPTDNQQSTTNNNGNNVNKGEKGAKSPPTIISQDWNPNQLNTEWMGDAGLSEIEQHRIIREFRDFWILSETKKKNWNLAFRKNPIVKGVVNRSAKSQPTQESWETAL